MEQWQQFERTWAQIVARAWFDEAFKSQLLENPQAVLQAHGLEVSDKYDIKVHLGGTKALVELPLPRKPAGLKEDSLSAKNSNDIGICSSCCCSC